MAYSEALKALLRSQGISEEEIARMEAEAAANATPKATPKPPKSGVFTRTYVSNNIPKDSTLKDTINKVFQRYYGRDALETELTTYLPMLQNKYKSKSGASKSTVKETYKN